MKILLPLFLLAATAGFGQKTSRALESGKDQVRDVTSSPALLAQYLTSLADNEGEKVTAIFRWITSNIAYDTKGYYNLGSIYKGLFEQADSLDSAAIFEKYNDN